MQQCSFLFLQRILSRLLCHCCTKSLLRSALVARLSEMLISKRVETITAIFGQIINFHHILRRNIGKCYRARAKYCWIRGANGKVSYAHILHHKDGGCRHKEVDPSGQYCRLDAEREKLLPAFNRIWHNENSRILLVIYVNKLNEQLTTAISHLGHE